ncbi:uncharacterized protein LOC144345424 [Saccoglossus kowalevskii]
MMLPKASIHSVLILFVVVCLGYVVDAAFDGDLESHGRRDEKVIRHSIKDLEFSIGHILERGRRSSENTTEDGNPWLEPVDDTIVWSIIGATLAVAVFVILAITLCSCMCNSSTEKRTQERKRQELQAEIDDELISSRNRLDNHYDSHQNDQEMWAWSRDSPPYMT